MADEKILGLVSGTRDGKLLVVTTPTRCDDVAEGEVYVGLVSGTRNGKPLMAISTQRCGATAGELEVDRGYLGLVSGARDGKLLLAVPCGDCESCAVLAGQRATPYPATLYVEDVLFMSASFPGVTYPFPIVETSPGSRVWTGTDPTGDYGFPVTFTMDCLGNIPGTLRFRAVGYFTNMLDAVGRTPSSFDPFICRFYQTVIGGVTCDVVE